MVKIATLRDCSICAKAKKLLLSNGIQFIEFNCDDYPYWCDELEDITKTHYYPIIIKDKSDRSLELYYIVDDYNQLYLDGSLINGYTMRPKFELNTLIKAIKLEK